MKTPETIVLGEERPVMPFENEEDFNNFLNIILQANKEVLNNSIYDDVTELEW